MSPEEYAQRGPRFDAHGTEIRETITVGRKDDGGKLRYDLIPPEALEELARVYTIGAAKYADRNWELGLAWGRVFAAMMRHAWAWWRGETFDPVDGQYHLSSVAWCAFALLTYELRNVGTDDRGIDTKP